MFQFVPESVWDLLQVWRQTFWLIEVEKGAGVTDSVNDGINLLSALS